MENKKKYAILALAAALIIVLIVVIVAVTNSGSGNETASNEQTTEEAYYTPVLMYFVSKNDPGYNDYMAVIDELRSEYDGRVTFDIIDIDEQPEAKENFPMVNGATPYAIMNDSTNTITALRPSCTDKSVLEGDIEAAL